MEDRKNWRIEFRGERGWCVIDQKIAEDDFWLEDGQFVAGLVAEDLPSQEAAQACIDNPTALFWSRLRNLLEVETSNPRQGVLLAELFKEVDEAVLVEANADPNNLGAMFERGFALSSPGEEQESETKWIDPIFIDLDAAFPGVNFVICTTRCYFGFPALQVEWNGNDVDGNEVVEALRKFDGKIELILECSPSRKDLEKIQDGLNQAAREGRLPF